MATTVRIPSVTVEGATVGEALDNLEAAFPGLKGCLRDEQASIAPFVSVFVDGEDVRRLDGLNTPLNGADLSIVPAAAGGFHRSALLRKAVRAARKAGGGYVATAAVDHITGQTAQQRPLDGTRLKLASSGATGNAKTVGDRWEIARDVGVGRGKVSPVGRDQRRLDGLHDHLARHVLLGGQLGDGSYEFTLHACGAASSVAQARADGVPRRAVRYNKRSGGHPPTSRWRR